MSNVTRLFEAAELAQASYASLFVGGTNLWINADALQSPSGAGISPTQLIDFAKRYPAIVTQFNDEPAKGGMGTGLSATVFKDTIGTTPGNLTLAFRGTELVPSDLGTDLNIWLAGAGYDQIVAMVNWWKRASAAKDEEVAQFSLGWMATSDVPAGAVVLSIVGEESYVLAAANPGIATGELYEALQSDPDHKVELTGHSMGGHLAMAFSTIFASSSASATVFNAPGFIDNATNRAFFVMLGGSIPAVGASNITNVIADEALIGEAPFKAIAGRKGADSGDTAGIGGGRRKAMHQRPRWCPGRRDMTSRRLRKTFLKTSAAIALAAALAGCAGWVPGRQSYWDAKVKEMCEKDGGVTIYEKLRISKSDIGLLGKVGEKIGVPARELADPSAPAYEELNITYLREGNPQVTRSEMRIVRRADKAVIARAIIYARSGGDFPSPAHSSSFSCPTLNEVVSDLQPLFDVQGVSQ
jgi:hypothetical protein